MKATWQKLKMWLVWMQELDLQGTITLDILWGDDHVSNKLLENGGDIDCWSYLIELGGEMVDWIQQYSNVVYLEVCNEHLPIGRAYATDFSPKVEGSVTHKVSAVIFI